MTDTSMQTTLIRQLFAKAAKQAGAEAMGALDVEGTLVDAATGASASAQDKGVFRQMIKLVAADGVLTDGEIRGLLVHLQKNGLTLVLPAQPANPLDLDAIDLGDWV